MGSFKERKDSKSVIYIWGPGKVGKTVLASQFPNNVFVQCKEDGLGSVTTMTKSLKLDIDFDRFFLDDAPSTDADLIKICGPEIAKGLGWTKAKVLVGYLCRHLPQDAWITIDHYTNLIDMCIEYYEATLKRRLQLQDWNQIVPEMKDFLDMFKLASTKCSSIILGHSESIKDDITGAINRQFFSPSPKLRTAIPSIPTEFLYMKAMSEGGTNTRKTKRVLQSVMDDKTYTGSYSQMPDIVYPTYEKMRPYLESSLGHSLPPALWTPPDPK